MATRLVEDLIVQRTLSVDELAAIAARAEHETALALLAGDVEEAKRFAAVAHEAHRRRQRRERSDAARLERRQVLAAQASESYAGLGARS